MKQVSWSCRLLVVGLVAAAASGAFSPGYSSCLSDKPEAILDCLSEAFAARDTTLYRDLFADDFRYCFGSETDCWGREKDFRAAKELFHSVTNLAIEFTDMGTAVPGDNAGTWLLTGVATLMKIDALTTGKPEHTEVVGKGQTLGVRLVQKPDTHLVIYRWWQPAD